MKDIKRGLWLMAVGVVLLVSATFVNAEEPRDQKDWIKGGIATKSNAGECLYKPFVQVAIADDDPDTGEAQLLGYTPGNVQVSHIDGKVIWERVYAKKFVKRGMPASGCMQKCPLYDE